MRPKYSDLPPVCIIVCGSTYVLPNLGTNSVIVCGSTYVLPNLGTNFTCYVLHMQGTCLNGSAVAENAMFNLKLWQTKSEISGQSLSQFYEG